MWQEAEEGHLNKLSTMQKGENAEIRKGESCR